MHTPLCCSLDITLLTTVQIRCTVQVGANEDRRPIPSCSETLRSCRCTFFTAGGRSATLLYVAFLLSSFLRDCCEPPLNFWSPPFFVKGTTLLTRRFTSWSVSCICIVVMPCDFAYILYLSRSLHVHVVWRMNMLTLIRYMENYAPKELRARSNLATIV